MRTAKDRQHILALALSTAVLTMSIGATARANPVTRATSLTWTWQSACAVGSQSPFNSAASNWRGAMSSFGISLSANDTTVFSSEIMDATFGGEDHINDNLDTADISFYATHGQAGRNDYCPYNGATDPNCSHTDWRGHETTTTSDPEGDCQVGTPQMYVGNTRTNYLDTFACESLELTWTNDYQSSVAFGLHQWHGFAGTMGTGTGTSTDLDDYFASGQGGGAAWAWMTWETSYHHWQSGGDTCAVSRTWGNSNADASARSANERYQDGSYSDPGWLYSKVLYYNDCDPPSPTPGPLGNWIVGWHNP